MSKKIIYLFLCFLLIGLPIKPKAAADETFSAKKTKIDKRINKGGHFVLSLSGTKSTPSWKTSNKKVATITKKSKYKYTVKGAGKGDCTISVKAGKTTYKMTLHVENPSLDKTKSVTVEKPITLSMGGLTSSARPSWTLEANKGSIVKITPNANKHSVKITGLKNGTANVFAYICGKTYTCKVTVTHTCSKHLKWAETKKATCKETGSKKQYCTICNKTIKTESIAKTAHKYTYVTTKEATCTEKGTQAEQCSFCGVKSGKTKEINPLGHNYEYVYTVNPTCNADGSKVNQCTRCHDLKTETIPKTGKHSWNGGEVIKKPTTSEVGYKKFTCVVCGAVKTDEIPKIAKSSSKKPVAKVSNAVKKPKLKLKNKSKRKIEAKWTKVNKISGYEVECLYKGKVIKSKTFKKLKYTFKKLKKKKKYTIRVRAFRNKGNVRYYSPWTKKTIKVKK